MARMPWRSRENAAVPEPQEVPVTVLIPTYRRSCALAVTLTSLAYQEFSAFDIVVSDQSEGNDAAVRGEVQAAVRLLRYRGHSVRLLHHVPRRGIAEQRQFLLEQSASRYSLFVDDDLILEPFVVGGLFRALQEEEAGFAGNALIGLSYINDVRPGEQDIEVWKGPVTPEDVEPDSPAWERYRLHNAANVLHVQEKFGATPDHPVKYRVAWVGGCVMYDTMKLKAAGGFSFWEELPPAHCGEDVLAQLRVMRMFGGFGLLPSGAYHQELPTTLPDRTVVAPKVLSVR